MTRESIQIPGLRGSRMDLEATPVGNGHCPDEDLLWSCWRPVGRQPGRERQQPRLLLPCELSELTQPVRTDVNGSGDGSAGALPR
ncbi:uncharacterized protein WM277_005785 isoform 2-T8 [Molossus nigricans]